MKPFEWFVKQTWAPFLVMAVVVVLIVIIKVIIKNIKKKGYITLSLLEYQKSFLSENVCTLDGLPLLHILL